MNHKKPTIIAERGTNMKKTHLIAALVGIIAMGIIAADASAYYHPTLGRFLTRDLGAGSAKRVGAGGPTVASGFIPMDQLGASRMPTPMTTGFSQPHVGVNVYPDAAAIMPTVHRDPMDPPVLFDPTGQHPDGPNLYQYVRSNPLRFVDPQGLAAKVCKWSGTISGLFTGTFFGGYAKVKVIAIGSDGKCNYAVSGKGTQWFGGAAFGIGYFSASVDFEDFKAPCEWPIKNGSGASLTILGAGGNAYIPVNLSEVIGTAGSLQAFGFCASGGLNIFIGGGAWGAKLADVKRVGPTPVGT